jgi:hypothetical protein
VLPFTRQIPKEEFMQKKESIIEFFPGADRASFSRSQAIFLHSGKLPDKAFAERMIGEYIDPDIFVGVAPQVFEPKSTFQKPMNTPALAAYRSAVIKSLESCRGFGHLDSMALVANLKSCGAGFADYQRICALAGRADSCIRDEKTQQATWNAVKDDIKVGKQKRDGFIAKFGGTPPTKQMFTPHQSKVQILQQKIKRLKEQQ